MKKSSLIILVITAIFLSFIGGMFLGRYHNTGSITVLAEHQSPTSKKININTATMDELCILPGISEITAQRIIDYRDKFGPFQSAAQLLDISGITETKLDEISKYITIE